MVIGVIILYFLKRAGVKAKLKASFSLTVRSNFRRVFQDNGGSGGFGVQKRL